MSPSIIQPCLHHFLQYHLGQFNLSDSHSVSLLVKCREEYLYLSTREKVCELPGMVPSICWVTQYAVAVYLHFFYGPCEETMFQPTWPKNGNLLDYTFQEKIEQYNSGMRQEELALRNNHNQKFKFWQHSLLIFRFCSSLYLFFCAYLRTLPSPTA